MPFPYTLPFALPAGDIGLSDLPAATRARFATDADAQTALDVALVAARRYCGWHVSPVVTDELVLDGPGSRVLQLPTRKLRDVVEVVENTVDIDIARLVWSQTGAVRKKSDAFWSFAYQAITATFDHGYTAAEAADWRDAIVSMVDDISTTAVSEEAGRLVRKKVDDVEYQWDAGDAASRAVLSVSYILDSYCLVPVYFA